MTKSAGKPTKQALWAARMVYAAAAGVAGGTVQFNGDGAKIFFECEFPAWLTVDGKFEVDFKGKQNEKWREYYRAKLQDRFQSRIDAAMKVIKSKGESL